MHTNIAFNDKFPNACGWAIEQDIDKVTYNTFIERFTKQTKGCFIAIQYGRDLYWQPRNQTYQYRYIPGQPPYEMYWFADTHIDKLLHTLVAYRGIVDIEQNYWNPFLSKKFDPLLLTVRTFWYDFYYKHLTLRNDTIRYKYDYVILYNDDDFIEIPPYKDIIPESFILKSERWKLSKPLKEYCAITNI